jgi:dTDP-4-amino-4,6-dideoxygalactose transaminase
MRVYQKLQDNGIWRGGISPLISDFPMYKDMPSAAHSNLPVATKVAAQVLCLPIYPALESTAVNRICQLIG